MILSPTICRLAARGAGGKGETGERHRDSRNNAHGCCSNSADGDGRTETSGSLGLHGCARSLQQLDSDTSYACPPCSARWACGKSKARHLFSKISAHVAWRRDARVHHHAAAAIPGRCVVIGPFYLLLPLPCFASAAPVTIKEQHLPSPSPGPSRCCSVQERRD